MIQFNFTTNEDVDISPIKERFHDALVGSSSYKESEIAIVDGDIPKCSFSLIVGAERPEPDKNLTMHIHFDALPTVEAANASVESKPASEADERPELETMDIDTLGL